MGDDVRSFPGRFYRKREIRGEIYDTPEPSDFMVWEICPHLRMVRGDDEYRCRGCPAWERSDIAAKYSDDDDEVCRVVMAVQARERALATITEGGADGG